MSTGKSALDKHWSPRYYLPNTLIPLAFSSSNPGPSLHDETPTSVPSSYTPNPRISRLRGAFSAHTKGLTTDQVKFTDQFFAGRNVCLSGSAGTGKSYVLKALFEFLTANGVSVGRTATTGVAAFNIGGSTIHSFAGLGLADEDAESIYLKLAKNSKVKGRIRAAEVLFLDEVSMAKGDLLNKLDYVFRHVRNKNESFGGCQFVFGGDPLQLPPVFKGDEVAQLFFDCVAWKAANVRVCVLHEIVRQKGDDTFVRVLNDIRVGRTDTLHLLTPRINAVFPSDGIEPVRIFSHNAKVIEYNAERLTQLKTQARTYRAHDSGTEWQIEAFNKNCPALQTLDLKVGAQVMNLVNSDQENGVVNGSIGVVMAFTGEGVRVRFSNGHQALIGRNEWTLKDQEVGVDGKIKYKVVATRSQIPLKLAWSNTTHKCQGLTLDRAIVDVTECFATGQAYCALSRVRDMNSLSIVGSIPHSSIRVDQRCVDFYDRAQTEETPL